MDIEQRLKRLNVMLVLVLLATGAIGLATGLSALQVQELEGRVAALEEAKILTE